MLNSRRISNRYWQRRRGL